MNCVCRHPVKFEAFPCELDLSCDHACTYCFFEDEGQPQRQNWLTACVGLNMNYSIIFTEISFYPETSILLQIIRIIHITIWFVQNSTEKGGQSACSGCNNFGKDSETPTD